MMMMAPSKQNSTSSKKNSRGLTFPLKLHQLICDANENGYEDVISWLPDGKKFKVHDRTKFANEIMPTFLGTSKYRSFQKNLNMWSFSNGSRGGVVLDGEGGAPLMSDTDSCTKGVYFHPFFIRDAPSFCHRMIRQAVYIKRKKKTPPGEVDSKARHDRKSGVDTAVLG
eukprot:CAMPEP_0117060292 /NCGR_PEP_ID=MMETSP0472-20121206/41904_1 /TAXON_ID=693140 ORGANISM="Tiarina fusus, Strain LIS" /NCGR_SAMPLE_ID=MMETSP0472 /ASSEMBLY_ACC=CAM_ASM_000603 /LENGTH=168 /DNA_ID=CAMNT_0004778379 /DNA_START=34 /DNA_END=537 /DNA_ORIENTATION=+